MVKVFILFLFYSDFLKMPGETLCYFHANFDISKTTCYSILNDLLF